MTVNPAADIFPRMSADEFSALKADIQQHGLRERIWVHQGQILDGRHHAQACQELGIPVAAREYTGDDPVNFVVSLNLKRRHLNASQLAYVGLAIERAEAERANQRMAAGGGDKKSGTEQIPYPIMNAGESRERAAQAVGINPHYITDAKFIGRKAPALAEQIRLGEKTITQAKREIKEQH